MHHESFIPQEIYSSYIKTIFLLILTKSRVEITKQLYRYMFSIICFKNTVLLKKIVLKETICSLKAWGGWGAGNLSQAGQRWNQVKSQAFKNTAMGNLTAS